MLVLLLISALDSVRGVCFEPIQTYEPRSVVGKISVASEAGCKVECLKMGSCESVVFSSNDQACFLLGDMLPGACGAPFWRSVKQTANCAAYNITASYDLDPCFVSATMTPQHLKLAQDSICPNTPLDGEPASRLYVVSVIYSDGTHGVYDDDSSARIIWNASISSYVFFYTNNGKVWINDPIYAASCAYYKAGGNAQRLSVRYASARALHKGQYRSDRGYGFGLWCMPSGIFGKVRFLIAKNGDPRNCGPCTNFKITCIRGMWIYQLPYGSLPNQINSFAFGNGTCYKN